MDIDRHVRQNIPSAEERVKFCLDQLEKAHSFAKTIEWQTEICRRLTVEEIIGALVSTEQELIGKEKGVDGGEHSILL